MKILIIDTTGPSSWISIVEKQENSFTIIQKKTMESLSLSKNLIPLIETLLESTTPNLMGVGIGPGSFTGTRVGAMVAKTLSFGWNTPLISFSSLLIPEFITIASFIYQAFTLNPIQKEVKLVYIPSTP